MTVREHLAEHHRITAAHHTRLAKVHHDRANNSTGDECDFHKAMGDAHFEHAEHNLECCKTCMKAVGDDLDKALTGVSAVNRFPEKGIRSAVPRTGAPEIEREKLPEQFARLVE